MFAFRRYSLTNRRNAAMKAYLRQLSHLAQAGLFTVVMLVVSPHAFAQFNDASVSGTVYNDLSGNGVNDVDPGLSGWTVDLFSASNVLLATMATGASGAYSFANLGPGTYHVSEVLQGGWGQTAPVPIPPGAYTFTTAAGLAITGDDFGNFQLDSLSGNVYNDLNDSGSQNSGEPGLAGWTVNVLDSTNSVVASGLTDALGNYTIQNLGPGSFTLAEVVQSGWTQTQPVSPNFYSFTTSSGVNIVGGIFGNFGSSVVPEPGTLSLLGLAIAGIGFARRREPN